MVADDLGWETVAADNAAAGMGAGTSPGYPDTQPDNAVAEQRRRSTISGQATDQLQSGFSAEELAIARRVLTTMGERAEVLLRPSDA